MMLLALAMLAVTAAQPARTMPMNVEKKVCRNLDMTGTMLKKRVCLTEKEWSEVDRLNRERATRAKGSYGV
jgi:hypothetical protein